MNEPTLRDVEQVLAVLTEIDPGDITDPQQLALYEADLKLMIQVSAEKRDRVAVKMFDLGQRAAVKHAAAMEHANKAEALNRAAKAYESRADQLKEYVLAVMRELPKPKRGVRTLEGETATFKAKGVPPSVEVAEYSLPDEFRRMIVTVPLLLWRELMECENESALKLALCKLARCPTAAAAATKSELKAALDELVDCPTCNGRGYEILGGQDEHGADNTQRCGDCDNGRVKRTIPGVLLVDNKLRLEVS